MSTPDVPLSLPEGWVIQHSKRYQNKIYYFNTITGHSVWNWPPGPEDAEAFAGHSIDEKHRIEEKGIEGKNYDYSSLGDASEIENTVDSKSKTSVESCRLSKTVPSSFVPQTAVVKPIVHHSSVSSDELKKALKKVKDSAAVSKTLCKTQATGSANKEQQKQRQKCVLKRNSSSVKEQSDYISKKGSSPVKKVLSASSEKRLKKSSQCLVRTKVGKNAEGNSSSSKYDLQDNRLSPSTSKSNLRGKDQNSSEILNAVQQLDNSSEDVEMLDVSLNLADLDHVIKAKGTLARNDGYHIVVDTNILIQELKIIDEIKDTNIEGFGPPHIIIPWVVIQELDTLKNISLKESHIRKTAADAVRYINAVLRAKHPRFHSQTPQEADNLAKKYKLVNVNNGKNDDRILETCMSLVDRISRQKVILLTNDTNLANKAIICHINVYDLKSLKAKLKQSGSSKASKRRVKKLRKKQKAMKDSSSIVVTKSVLNSSDANLSSVDLNSSASTCGNILDNNDVIENEFLLEQHKQYKEEIHVLMSDAKQLLKNVLDPFLEKEMSEAYGDAWSSFPIDKETLKGVLEAVKKYWNTVFAFSFSSKDKNNFDLLLEKASRPAGFFGDKDECLTILTGIEDVFCSIQRRWSEISVPVEKIQDARVACIKAFLKHSETTNAIHLAEIQSAYSIFQNNWNVMNRLCGMFMDFCDLPHDFSYERPAVFPPESDFRQLMCNLYPSVQNLKKIMSSMIDAVNKSNAGVEVFRKLHKALKNFIPSLEIEIEFPPFPYFTVEGLQSFCLHPENKQMIDIGSKQLEKFFNKLDEALRLMMTSKFKKISQEAMICE